MTGRSRSATATALTKAATSSGDVRRDGERQPHVEIRTQDDAGRGWERGRAHGAHCVRGPHHTWRGETILSRLRGIPPPFVTTQKYMAHLERQQRKGTTVVFCMSTNAGSEDASPPCTDPDTCKACKGITTGRQNPYGSRVRVTRVRVRVAILGPVPNPYPWHGYPRFRHHYLAQDDNEAHFHLTNIDRPRVPASRAVSVRHARIGGNVAHLRFSPSPHLYFGLGILTSLYDQNSPLEQLHTPSFCTSFDAENSSMVRREVAVGDAKPPPHVSLSRASTA
ncbi:hypothetical protein EDB85DRAFT_1899226 [Lactarius pseudohatsudake]|nr:hypothetical protein EDB85DRAFT_1899226 [Lactarius pseudohatsudake]